MLLSCSSVFAQHKITAVLKDASNDEAISYATVSLTKKGQEKPTKYTLSGESGDILLESVRKGEYVVKAELLGYIPVSVEVNMESEDIDLGELKMETDAEQLEAAKVSAAGNPVIIKKDTIEYNASSYITKENAVLEDLLKKLPGIEVSENGTITSNGQTISKITIDGKTFFLDDPQVASKNIPAKLVQKLKVIKKKSEQAEFTGIDDGQEETVIDLSVMPGMMNGIIGRATAGAGHDIPSSSNTNNDFRFTGNVFLGNFSDKLQVSLILNANNANAAGASNRGGNMMGMMMGGGGMMGMGQGGFGGGNGITTTYMAGTNVAGNLFDDRMELGGNYMFNWRGTDVMESSLKTTYRPNATNLVYNSDGKSNNISRNHSVGFRLDHEFSKNTSILFQPQISFGSGSYFQKSNEITYDDVMKAGNELKDATIDNSGVNKNVTASAMFLFRQRLGIPGRTLSVMGNLSYTTNGSDGHNYNISNNYRSNGNSTSSIINQNFNSLQNSTSLMANVTYTEPMGNHLYLEAEYAYNFSKSVNDKETFDVQTGLKDFAYSNNIININTNQQIGANLLYQSDSFRAQVGFFAMPNHTYNSTTQYNSQTKEYIPVEYVDDRWNFSPQAMVFGEFSENSSLRFFYRGNSAQPSTSQLMPVPDNTNPLSISFGNPSLAPYFNHNIHGDYRISNRQTFFTFNANFNGGMVQNPIVSAMWYGANGEQYTMPFNGPDSGNLGLNTMLNTPIGKSDFTISNSLGGQWSVSSSYVGKDIDMSLYPDPLTHYYEFMKAFTKDHPNILEDKNFALNKTNSLNLNERFRLTYRLDALQLDASFNTRMNRSWYSVASEKDMTTTWNNQVAFGGEWNLIDAGLSFSAHYNFNWYKGYTTDQPNESVLNMDISKTLFKGLCTLTLSGYDLLGQSRNLMVSDNSNYHQESVNNTLGRYVILSLSFNFGSMGRGRGGMMGGPMGGGRGMRGGGMPMGGPGMGMPMGGGPGGRR